MRRAFLLFSVLPSLLLAAQPYMVKDITPVPIPESSYPSYVGTAGGITYIQAFGALWKTDGTAAGTVEVGKVSVATARQGPSAVAVGNRLVFLAFNGYQMQLFSTDGTETTRLSRLTYGVDNVFGDGSRAFFCGFDGLWVTDGTPLGTRQLFRFPAGAVLGRIGNDILFSDWHHLYRTDGSREPTLIDQASAYQSMGVTFGDRVVFSEVERLRITDGTPGGTRTISSELRYDGRLDAVISGDQLFFVGRGNSLWVTDGTAKGTRQLAQCCVIDKPVAGGDGVYYATSSRSGSCDLWKTNGTPQGASLVAHSTGPMTLTSWNGRVFYAADRSVVAPGIAASDLSPATFDHFIAPIGERLFFSARDPATGEELWSVGPEGRDARLTINLAPDRRTSRTNFLWMQTLADHVLFIESDTSQHAALWRSDGTESGTYSLAALPLPPAEVRSVAVNGVCYISLGSEGLWRSDGTMAGTYQLADRSNDVAGFRDGVIFEGFDEMSGYEPWISDGTRAGTHRIADVLPGPASGGMRGGVEIGERFYFASYDFRKRLLLWHTEGTTATLIASPPIIRTSLTEFQGAVYAVTGDDLMKLRDGTWTERIGHAGGRIFTVGPRLLILGDDILYRSDGTTMDIPFRGFSQSCGAFVDGSLLYWLSGEGLWRSDGTETGTFRVARVAPSACSLVRSGRWAYFLANSGQIWTADLTSDQSFQVTDLPGSFLRSATGLAVAGSKLFFVGDDGVHGDELWALPLDTLHRRAWGYAVRPTNPVVTATRRPASAAAMSISLSAMGRRKSPSMYETAAPSR